jgi:hypothetical protein
VVVSLLVYWRQGLVAGVATRRRCGEVGRLRRRAAMAVGCDRQSIRRRHLRSRSSQRPREGCLDWIHATGKGRRWFGSQCGLVGGRWVAQTSGRLTHATCTDTDMDMDSEMGRRREQEGKFELKAPWRLSLRGGLDSGLGLVDVQRRQTPAQSGQSYLRKCTDHAASAPT